jgi:hypothetical protein
MTIAIPGYGSKLQLQNGSAWLTIAQLRKMSPSGDGSKQNMLDQTNILTAGNGCAPIPGRVDAGEYDIEGVVIPTNSSQLELGTLHYAGTLAQWQLLLSDGVTTWTFLAYVSTYKPFDIPAGDKAVIFAARLRVSGTQTGPAGAV